MFNIGANLKITERISLHILVAFALMPSFPSSALTSGTDENVLEAALSYGQYKAELKTATQKPSPFFMVVDSKGTGHLSAIKINPAFNTRDIAKRTEDGLPIDWNARFSFFKGKQGWKSLTLKDATLLWGTPKRHVLKEYEFCTFDVHSTYVEEENTYHLDLQFGDAESIIKYRIRGIGIFNPRWVEKERGSK